MTRQRVLRLVAALLLPLGGLAVAPDTVVQASPSTTSALVTARQQAGTISNEQP